MKSEKAFLGFVILLSFTLQALQFWLGISPGTHGWINSYLPEIIGDVVAMMTWIGAEPLALSLVLVACIRSIRWALAAIALFVLSALLLEPFKNHLEAFEHGGNGLDAKSALLSQLALLMIGIAVFAGVVLLPRMLIAPARKWKRYIERTRMNALAYSPLESAYCHFPPHPDQVRGVRVVRKITWKRAQC